MIDLVIELSKYNDPGIIEKYKPIPEEELRILERDNVSILDSISDMKAIISIAIEAVYGYRDGYCDTRCDLRNLMIQKFGEDTFSGPERPKCYECHQNYFINMLSMLTKGWPYSQVPGLMYLLNNSSRFVKRTLQPILKSDDVTEQLEEVVVFRAEDPFFFGAMEGAPPMAYKGIFRNFLYNFVANDLTEFLLNNDRQKLKICQWCEKYFIAKKVDLRTKFCPICSSKTKMTKEWQKKYYKNRIKEKKEQKKAEEDVKKDIKIKNYMKALDISMEDAIELYEEEKDM